MRFSRTSRRQGTGLPISIGRHQFIQKYLEELNRPPNEARLVTSVYGVGGVGKSTLLDHFMSLKTDRTLYSRVDELSSFGGDGKQLIQIIGDQLSSDGSKIDLQNLTRQMRKYDELLERLDKEGEQGANRLREYLLLGTKIAVEMVAGNTAGEVMERIGRPLGRALGRGWEQVRGAHRLVRSIEGRAMMNDPLKVLTHAFVDDLDDLARQQNIRVIMMFDTYERIGPAVDKWMLDYLIPALIRNKIGCCVFR